MQKIPINFLVVSSLIKGRQLQMDQEENLFGLSSDSVLHDFIL